MSPNKGVRHHGCEITQRLKLAGEVYLYPGWLQQWFPWEWEGLRSGTAALSAHGRARGEAAAS